MATTRNITTNPVQVEAAEEIVEYLEGDLALGDPAGDSPGTSFLLDCIQGVQQLIKDQGMDYFLDDPRGNAPDVGDSPLAKLDAAAMLTVAGAIPATDFHGDVPGSPFEDLEDAVKWTLRAIHDDVYSATADLIGAGVLDWDDDKLVMVPVED